MGKSRTDRRGLTREQQLLNENKMLKRENSKLRKMIAKSDLNRYENVKKTIDDYGKNVSTTEDLLETLKKEWACNKESCEGYLEVVLFSKIDTTHYYRTCSHCSNRTRSQKYDPKSVRGIIKNTESK